MNQSRQLGWNDSPGGMEPRKGESMRFIVIEHGPYGSCRSEHTSYLEALLYLLRRSSGTNRDESEIRQEDGTGTSPVVKIYTGAAYPTAEDVAHAVANPDRAAGAS